MTTEDQILALLAKIAEKKNSNDKLDLWLVEHWSNEIIKLKEQLKSESRRNSPMGNR